MKGNILMFNYMKTQPFQVDLNNLLTIVSEHLYVEKTVFIKEILTNAIGTIQERMRNEKIIPAINVQIFDNSEATGLVITDNGCGFSKDQLFSFIDQIFSNVQYIKDGSEFRNTCVSQLGISIISCFMAAHTVTIISKDKNSAHAYRWEGNIDGYFIMEKVSEFENQGTRICLTFQKDRGLNSTVLFSNIRKYGEFVKESIAVEINGESKGIINKKFPWEQNSSNEEVLAFGKEIFTLNFSNFFFLKSEKDDSLQGIVYILPFPSDHKRENNSAVYVNGMFISNNCSIIMPEWASFVRVVLNNPLLTLNASRDNIHKNIKSNTLKDHIGTSIKKYLVDLCRTSPELLRAILEIHAPTVKRLVLEDSDLLSKLFSFLPFYTNMGEMTIADIKKRYNEIYYIPDINGFRQLYPIAKSSDKLVINAGFPFESSLLLAIGIMDNEISYIEIDADFYGDFLHGIDEDEIDIYIDRIEELQLFLHKFNCQLELKRFTPVSLPAIFQSCVNMPLVKGLDQLKGENLELWASVSKIMYKKGNYDASMLYLNIDNPVVRKLFRKQSKHDREVLETMLINAMLIGNYPLSFIEVEAMSNNFGVLLSLALEGKQQ